MLENMDLVEQGKKLEKHRDFKEGSVFEFDFPGLRKRILILYIEWPLAVGKDQDGDERVWDLSQAYSSKDVGVLNRVPKAPDTTAVKYDKSNPNHVKVKE